MWTPTYWLSGYVKLATAVASVATALALPPLVPKALGLIETAKMSEKFRLDLAMANTDLERELGERRRAEEELQRAHNELERRVEERTAALAESNELLKKENEERRQAEERLRGSEELNQAMLNSLTAHIAVLDRDGTIIRVNNAWRRFARENGAGEGDAAPRTDVGTNYLQVCQPSAGGEARAIYEGINSVLDGASDGFTLEYPCHSPTEERWFTLYVNPLAGGRGGAVVSHFDITERKQAEAAAREREQQFATLADSIPQLAWMAEADGHIFWYNRRWYEYTGTTPDEMEGWGWQKVHDPEVLPQVVERWSESIKTAEPFEMSFPLRGAGGEFRRFLTRVLPLRDSGGGVVRWFGTNTDVEEQKRMETTLARLNEERKAVLEEVSTPVVPVWRDVLALPLVGSLDVERMMRATQSALDEVTRTNAQLCIIDITGARIVDAQAVANLSNLVASLKLVGADAVVAGVTAQAARTLVQLGLDLSQMRTHRTLAEALAMFIKSHTSNTQGTGNTRNAVSKNFR